MLRSNFITLTQNSSATLQARIHTIPVLITLLFGGAFRFFNLGSESYWVDEIIMLQLAGDNIATLMAHLVESGRPPVYVLATHVWVQTFGTAETVTRALSALFSTAALITMYAVGRELFSKKVALVGTFLMALSGYQIFYAQELRYYSLFVLFTLLSFFAFIRFLRQKNLITALFFSFTTVLMFYTHAYGLFVIAAQGLAFLLFWPRERRFIALWGLSQVLIAAAITPILLKMFVMVGNQGGPMNWMSLPRPYEPIITVYRYLFGYDARLTPTELAVGLAFLLLGMLGFIRWKGLRHWLGSVRNSIPALRNQLNQKQALTITGLWLLFPLLLPFALSFVLGPMFLGRYSIGATPALYLLLAVGIVSVRNIVPLGITMGTAAVLMTPGLYSYYTHDLQEQWRDVAEYIEGHEQPGDMIVFTRSLNDMIPASLRWYYQGDLPQCVMRDQVAGDDPAIYQDMERCTHDSQRFWLIERHWSTPYTHYVTTEFLEKHHTTFVKIDEQQFTRVTVYLLQTPAFGSDTQEVVSD
ncbi:MAG: glycosyltransferase family 39 protein [Chloroflexaceae bacterium]